MRQRRSSPWSSNFGSATFGTLVPESEVVVSAVRISLPRIFDDVLVARVRLDGLRPGIEQPLGFGIKLLFFQQRIDFRDFLAQHLFVAESCCRSRASFDLLLGERVVAAHRLGDLGEVALALRRHDDVASRRTPCRRLRQRAGLEPEALPASFAATAW